MNNELEEIGEVSVPENTGAQEKETEKKKKNSKYEIDMTTGSIGRKMLKFAIPLILSGMLQVLFNTADTIVVGRWAGDASLAAVGASGALFFLFTNLLIGTATGINVTVARDYGTGKIKPLQDSIHTSMALAIAGGFLIGIAGFFAARPILIIMDTPGEILDLATLYLRIVFAGMPVSAVYNFGSAILRAKGDTRRPLYYLSIAGVLNICLNLFFVIVLHMAVEGVALATVISQILSMALTLRCLTHEEPKFRLVIKHIRFNKTKVKQILSVGIPAGLQSCMFSFSNLFIQSAINSFGPIVMAGSAAASSLENFTYIGINSFTQAATSFTSQNIGAGKISRIKNISQKANILAILVGLIMGFATCFAGNFLVGIYTTNPESIAQGVYRLWFVCGMYFVYAPMDVITGVLRGMGSSTSTTIISLLGICVLRIIFFTTLFALPVFHTLFWVYATWPISWVVTGIAQFVLYKIRFRQLQGNVKV